MKRFAISGMGIVLFVILFVGTIAMGARAQAPASSSSQTAPTGQSLGDYARQVRKEPDAKAKPKVFDNDNLPKNDKLSVVGAAAATEILSEPKKDEAQTATPASEPKPGAESQAATADKNSAPAGAKAPQDEATKEAAWKQWGQKVTAQKEQVDLLTRELDVLQREYQIRAAAMYADAGNRLRNQADWDKQDAQYKQQIADKQKSLDGAKQKLDDTRDEAHRAGVPDSFLE